MYLTGELAPERVLLDFGAFQIYWYSVLLVVAVFAGYRVAQRRFKIGVLESSVKLDDAVFYAIIGGIIGARLWHVFVFQWQYYSANPVEIVQIWHGGIAIQGAIIGGLVALYWYARSHYGRLLLLTDIFAPAVALGQAIGRWGNFFNQELYGRPTNVPWGIFIEPENRVSGFESATHFHPAFLYESILDLALFFFLMRYSRGNRKTGSITAVYILGYGIIRFIVDVVRIDPMPAARVLRLSQIISLIFVSVGLTWLMLTRKRAV